MKDTYTIILSCMLTGFLNANEPSVTYLSPRSESVNVARILSGWQNFTHLDVDHCYLVTDLTPEVTYSFRPDRITQCFFGTQTTGCKNRITISGSRTDNRSSTDLLADYFGLPPDFLSIVQFKPSVTNTILHWDTFIGLNGLVKGLYLIAHIPLVYTRWHFSACEDICSSGTLGYEAGYFSPQEVDRTQLNSSFLSFATGCAPNIPALTFEPLCNAKIPCGSLRKTTCAEGIIAIGYDPLLSNWYHLGGNVRLAIPCGNRPEGIFLFEPIVGNGHHWEAGIGISGHVLFYQNDECNEEVGLYTAATITHQFATCQRRSFDLCGKNVSRYMLAQQMSSTIIDNLRGQVEGQLITPLAQFQPIITPVANLTTLSIKVSTTIQYDFAIALGYSAYPWSWLLGFGTWGRTCESITLCDLPFSEPVWALKGDSHVFGFQGTTAVPLSATQSDATIFSGTNFVGPNNQTTIEKGKQNIGVDNARFAFSDALNTGMFVTDLSTPNGINHINTSIQPIILTNADIDVGSAQNRNAVNKLFGHVAYEWNCSYFIPFLGFGAQVEFGGTTDPSRNKKGNCINCAFSQWSIWLKGGITFE